MAHIGVERSQEAISKAPMAVDGSAPLELAARDGNTVW